MILPIERFNEFDCITQLEPVANVCLSKDVLEATTGAWWDFLVTHIDLPNINYKFIAFKQYVWWNYGYLDKKKRKPLSSSVIKKSCAVFPVREGHFNVPAILDNFIMLYEIC